MCLDAHSITLRRTIKTNLRLKHFQKCCLVDTISLLFVCSCLLFKKVFLDMCNRINTPYMRENVSMSHKNIHKMWKITNEFEW